MAAATAIVILKLVIGVLSTLIALALGCAVGVAYLLDRATVRTEDGTAPDPLCWAHGDQPGFSRAQLDELAASSLERAARDPLRRSFEVRKPRHFRPLYSHCCIRCGATTAAEFAAACSSDRFASATAPRRTTGGGRSDVPSGAPAVRKPSLRRSLTAGDADAAGLLGRGRRA